MLKVRPHTKSGGGTVHFRSDIRKVGGGGGNSLQVRYEKWGGGGQFASGSIRKVCVCVCVGGGVNSLRVRYEKWRGGGGGGNSLQVRYEKWGGVWHKENTLSLIINGYNFDQGGAQELHTCARMNLIVVFNFIHSLIVSFLRRRGVPEPPKYATDFSNPRVP